MEKIQRINFMVELKSKSFMINLIINNYIYYIIYLLHLLSIWKMEK
jgi:hypothetical protein